MSVLAIEVTASLPETLWGWVAVVAGIVTTLGLILGFVIRTGRGHIDNKVKITMKDEIKESVDECVAPLVVSVNTLVAQRNEDLESRIVYREVVSDAVQRIVGLETTINNGLTHATEQTAKDVESMKIQLAEMHGWMKATHSETWDGSTERRS